MKWKEHISRFVLSRYKDDKRSRKGCSLQNAESVGILYKERDHGFYRTIKDIAKHFQDELGVKRVSMLSYVDEDSKRTPGWLVKKLDSGYFCKSDLNWYGKPVKEIEAFTEDFNIPFQNFSELQTNFNVDELSTDQIIKNNAESVLNIDTGG